MTLFLADPKFEAKYQKSETFASTVMESVCFWGNVFDKKNVNIFNYSNIAFNKINT